MGKAKRRIDQLLVEHGLAESRAAAQRLVMAGQVRVDGQPIHKASSLVLSGAEIEVQRGPRYVSRGGEKLEAALAAFRLNPEGWVCADVGASTGGFTDCLLQHGASKVYAIDVGHGEFHWRLRNDERVRLMERTNARYLLELPEQIRLVTVDVSFISLKLVLPSIKRWLSPEGEVVALVKPQFEAGREQVGKGGVVRDPDTHRQVLHGVIDQSAKLGLYPDALIRSPLLGPKGNVEFLLRLKQAASAGTEELVEGVVKAA